jgi:hypothetical protein
MHTVAFISVVSLGLVLHVGIVRWRAVLLQVASETVVVPINHASKLLMRREFGDLTALQKLCPSAPKLYSVRLYHCLLQLLAGVAPAD